MELGKRYFTVLDPVMENHYNAVGAQCSIQLLDNITREIRMDTQFFRPIASLCRRWIQTTKNCNSVVLINNRHS